MSNANNIEYFTYEGLPRITNEFHSAFLDRMSKQDPQELLTEWVERMKSENPGILRHAVSFAEQFPERDRNRIVFGQLLSYEMLRQRAIEIAEETSYGR